MHATENTAAGVNEPSTPAAIPMPPSRLRSLTTRTGIAIVVGALLVVVFLETRSIFSSNRKKRDQNKEVSPTTEDTMAKLSAATFPLPPSRKAYGPLNQTTQTIEPGDLQRPQITLTSPNTAGNWKFVLQERARGRLSADGLKLPLPGYSRKQRRENQQKNNEKLAELRSARSQPSPAVRLPAPEKRSTDEAEDESDGGVLLPRSAQSEPPPPSHERRRVHFECVDESEDHLSGVLIDDPDNKGKAGQQSVERGRRRARNGVVESRDTTDDSTVWDRRGRSPGARPPPKGMKTCVEEDSERELEEKDELVEEAKRTGGAVALSQAEQSSRTDREENASIQKRSEAVEQVPVKRAAAGWIPAQEPESEK